MKFDISASENKEKVHFTVYRNGAEYSKGMVQVDNIGLDDVQFPQHSDSYVDDCISYEIYSDEFYAAQAVYDSLIEKQSLDVVAYLQKELYLATGDVVKVFLSEGKEIKVFMVSHFGDIMEIC